MKILKKIIKWLLIIWAVVGLVIAGMWLANSPADLESESDSLARLEKANHSFEKMILEVIDLTRATPAMGKFEGDDKRVLKGAIWYPEGDTTDLPLIVYNHGFGGYHKDSTHLVEYLASNGYVVAAIDFPLSTAKSPAGVPQLEDVVSQPGDVTAVINQLLIMNSDVDSALYQRIDTNNIGAMGLSLGGLTTALVSFHPDLTDQRIKASVMMAPPLEAFSDQFYASNPKVKSLLISGSMDRVVPEPANANDVKPRHPKGWFMSFDKGTHLGFADVGNHLRWMENPDDLGCAFMAYMLERLTLPERWDAVIPTTNGVLRDIEVSDPCPDLAGQSLNGLKQQWLTQLAIGSFFDTHLQSGSRAEDASRFFRDTLVSENPEVSLRAPL